MKTKIAIFIMTLFFIYSCDNDTEDRRPPADEIGKLKIENLNFLDSYIPVDFYNDLTFTNENTGYAISRSGKIVKTTDAGNTWTLLNPLGGFYLNKIQFINENVGYVIGGDTKGSYLLKTIDAGQSWTVFDVNSAEKGYPSGLFFKNENEGYITGSKLFIKTVDGGQNWTDVLANTTENFSDVKFKDNNFGIATTNTSDYYQTTNGGISWQIINSTNQNNSGKIYFVGNKTFIKSGNKLVDIQSNLTVDLPNPADKLLFLNENKCVGIGQHYATGFFPYGDILLTNDNWTSFLQKTYAPYTEILDVNAIAKVNNHKIMAIGRGTKTAKILLLTY